MNAAQEMSAAAEKAIPLPAHSEEAKRLAAYVPKPPSQGDLINCGIENTKWYLGTDFVRDWEPAFQRFVSFASLLTKLSSTSTDETECFTRYVERLMLTELGDFVGAAMKEENTIVEKWPNRLKFDPATQEGKDEFHRRITSILGGEERYVEWVRAPRTRSMKPIPAYVRSRCDPAPSQALARAAQSSNVLYELQGFSPERSQYPSREKPRGWRSGHRPWRCQCRRGD